MSLIKVISFTPQAFLPAEGESLEELRPFYTELEYARRLGLRLADCPKGVVHAIQAHSATCGPLGKKVLLKLIQELECTQHQSGDCATEPEWLHEASRTSTDVPLDAYFLREQQGSRLPWKVFLSRDLESHPEAIAAITPARSVTFRMTPEGWAAALRPLLARSQKAAVADPYFDLSNPGCNDALDAILPRGQASALRFFEIITSDKALSGRTFAAFRWEQERYLGALGARHPEISLRLYGFNGRAFHDRNLFTCHQGILISNSLTCSNRYAQVAQVDEKDPRRRRQAIFPDSTLTLLAACNAGGGRSE